MADPSREMLLKLLINAQDNSGPATKSANQNIETIASTAQKVATLVKGYLTYQVVVRGVEEFLRLSDIATMMSSRLKIATQSQQEFNRAQDGLFEVAQQTRTGLESVVALYAQTSRTMRDLGKTQEDSLTLNRAINESYKISGASTAEAEGSLRQFIQSLQSGQFRGEEFNSVMEQGPRLAQALADGLGVPKDSLRGLAEQGKLTAAAITDALLGQAGKIHAEYAQIENTIAGSITQWNNALLRFVATSEQAHSITQKLAGGISYLSEHVDDATQIAEALATVLVGKLALGMTGWTAALVANTLAAREKATADMAQVEAGRALIATQAQAAAISLKAAQAQTQLAAATYDTAVATTASARATAGVLGLQALALEKTAAGSVAAAAAQARLATAEAEVTVAAKAETAAERGLSNALEQQSIASRQAAAANTAATGPLAAVSKGAKATSLAFEALNAVLLLPLAWEFGQTIGEWATQFEKVRIAGSYLAEMFAGLAIDWQLLKGEVSLREHDAALMRLNDEFNEIRQNLKDSAQEATTTQQTQTEQIKQQQAAQREAFTLTEAKLKEATKLMEGHYARQTEAALFGLAAKKVAIEGSALNETVQAQRIVEAERVSLTQRLQAIGLYGQQRIALINQTLGTQAQIEQLSGEARKAAETASLEARKAAYADLAKAYAAVVDDIQGEWQREMQAYQAGTEGIKNLALAHEQQILELKRLGMTEREKLRSEEQERDAAISQFKAEAAKGEQADEKELIRLYGEATKLIGEVSQSKIAHAKYTVDKSTEIRQAETGLNELYDLQKGALEKINGQHKANADTLLPSLDTAKGKLAEMNTALDALDKSLAQAKALKLELDAGSLANAQGEIAKLTATETKTIVVQTVSSDAAPAPEGKRWGGLVRALANGGRLPGYGGGDRRLILAEDGEMIVNKEATANNQDLLAKINRYGALQKFASGGTVADPVARAYEVAFAKRLDDKLLLMINTSYVAGSGFSEGESFTSMDKTTREIQAAIDRAPAAIQDSLRQKVLEKLYAISTQADTSVDKVMDYTNDPMSTLHMEPGALAKAQRNKEFWRKKISDFGGQDIGGAALGGFKRYDAMMQRDMPYATDISGNVPTANAPTAGTTATSSRASLQEAIASQINAALADAAKIAETAQANLAAAGAGPASASTPAWSATPNPPSMSTPNAAGYANPTTQATIRLELALPTGKVVPADVPSQFETDLREVKRQMRAT